MVAGGLDSGQIRPDLSLGARLVARDEGRGSSWSGLRVGAAAVASQIMVPAWMWAATTWWWLMAVVWIISGQRLVISGGGPSVSGLGWPSIPLLVARALPSSKGWLSPSCGPSFVSRPMVQDRAHFAPGSRTEPVSHPVPQDGSMEAILPAY